MVTATFIQEPSFPPLSNKSLIGLIQVVANNILIPTDYPRKIVLNRFKTEACASYDHYDDVQLHRNALHGTNESL